MKRFFIFIIFTGLFLNSNATNILIERLVGEDLKIEQVSSIQFLPSNNIICTATNGTIKEINQVRTLLLSDLLYTAVDNILSKSLVNIYPNPTTSCLIIENAVANTAMTIYTIDGIIIESHAAKDGINMLNVSHLPNGIYLLQLSNDTFKLVKE